MGIIGASYTGHMRYHCIVSYRTNRTKSVNIWRTHAHGTDIPTVTANIISQLKRRQRRTVDVLGMYIRQKT